MKKGITLVEVLVVITIIGILTGIIWTSTNSIIKNKKKYDLLCKKWKNYTVEYIPVECLDYFDLK